MIALTNSDLPDIPDDIPPLDLSVLKGGNPMLAALHEPGWDGLSILERQAKERAEKDDRNIRRDEAALLRDIESMPMPCFHSPDCPGEVCKDTIKKTKAAEEQFRKTMAAIDAEEPPSWRKVLEKEVPSTLPNGILKPKASATVATSAKRAPAPSIKPLASSAKAHLMNANLTSRPKKTPTPSNPSPMRHNAAIAASKTTMGYSKGRKASATLRQTVLPGKENARAVPDTSLPPAEYVARYGIPRVGTDIWFRCKRSGCLDDDNDREEGASVEELMGLDKEDDFLRQEAEQDFVLTLQD